ncbi:hypothetical protein N9I60_02840 [Planktomarina temperata]|nr:hypothetical protein [Planktomarina temperata]
MKKLCVMLMCLGSPSFSFAETVTIDADTLSLALYGMPTTPSKEEMLFAMEDSLVKLVNARLYGKDTSNRWLLLIGDNTPRIVCIQETKEAKRYVIALKNKIPQATVTGKWWKNINNVVYLENCTVEGL